MSSIDKNKNIGDIKESVDKILHDTVDSMSMENIYDIIGQLKLSINELHKKFDKISKLLEQNQKNINNKTKTTKNRETISIRFPAGFIKYVIDELLDNDNYNEPEFNKFKQYLDEEFKKSNIDKKTVDNVNKIFKSYTNQNGDTLYKSLLDKFKEYQEINKSAKKASNKKSSRTKTTTKSKGIKVTKNSKNTNEKKKITSTRKNKKTKEKEIDKNDQEDIDDTQNDDSDDEILNKEDD